MARELHTVALLTGNEALSSLLSALLAESPLLRVRRFASSLALACYARIAPVDLIVADLDDPAFDPELLDGAGVSTAPVLGMARGLAAAAGGAEGVAEIVAKPVSPAHLLDRVLARLRSPAPARTTGPNFRVFPANVIPLFREPPQSRP